MNPFWEPSLNISLRRHENSSEEMDTPDAATANPYLGRSLGPRQLWLTGLVITVGFLVLIGRAVSLQLIRGNDYRGLAEGNRLRIKTIAAPRGLIYDRYGRLLADNVPALSLALVPHDLPRDSKEKERIIKEVSESIGVPVDKISSFWRDLIERHGSSTDFFNLASNLPLEEGPRLKVLANSWPGVEVTLRPLRIYPSVEDGALSLSHVLGYVGEVTKEDISSGREQNYSLSDEIGKNGLELYFESMLRGENGRREVEVNALGQEKQLLAETAPTPGKNIWLTIDLELQGEVEAALKTGLKRAQASRGAVVVLDASDSSVLAMVSWPSFDANDFTKGLSLEQYEALKNDPDHPLFNRAVQGLYPPGSVIKPLIAAAALSQGIITGTTQYLSVGGFGIGQSFFPDWKAGGHGLTSVRRALAESVNTFFYIIGGGYEKFLGLGIEKIGEYAHLFGLGEKTNIDLPNEAVGLVPNPEWKMAAQKRPWYIGDTYHVAIGQGDLLVTPLQIVNYIAGIANNGTLYEPHLFLETSSEASAGHERRPLKIKKSNIIDESDLKIVREGMRQTITSGSAQALADLSIDVAGKTGTAEMGNRKPHAWFTGFAPWQSPQIVVVVVIENAGEGSTYAVPVAKEILQWWSLNRLEN